MTGNERRWGAMRVVMSFDLYIWWRQWKYDRWFAYWMAIADSLRAGWHIALNNIHVSWFCQSLRHILRDTHLTLSHQSHTCSSYFQFTPLQAWGYNCEYNVCFLLLYLFSMLAHVYFRYDMPVNEEIVPFCLFTKVDANKTYSEAYDVLAVIQLFFLMP